MPRGQTTLMKGARIETASRSIGKWWLFRIFAVLISLAPIVAAEITFRAADWGRPAELDDPYVGFTAIRPLFSLDETGQQYRIDPARQQYFRPDSFAAKKGPDEFRIFCLGGSTVQGRPYAIETSFTTWLELSLQAADSRYKWQVVNCGGISYASYRLVAILRELVVREPDLFIIYTGHNEFLEDRTYQDVKETSTAVRHYHSLFSNLRTYNSLRSFWLRASKQESPKPRPQNELPVEVDALLDYWDGLADYHRDDQWKRGVVDHYRLNLLRMIALARAARVPVVLANPVSNLRGCPPFKFEISQSLPLSQRTSFQMAWDDARFYDGHDPAQQIELLKQALVIDDRHAGAHYLLGKSYEGTGHLKEAAVAYLRAKEEDICPLRMIEPLHDALRQVARATKTPLVDARALIEDKSRYGIPGDGWLLDHVHPSINGHQLIADSLLEEMSRLRLVRPKANWRIRQKQLYDSHLESLNDLYFAHGRQRLEGLIRWTQGRANKIKPGQQGVEMTDLDSL